MRYERYTLRRTSSRTVYAAYDAVASEPVYVRDRAPLASTDRMKVDRLVAALNDATDAATVAGALIDFGATQSAAWRYAQSVYALESVSHD